MLINDPAIVREVEAAFAAYENALMTNDLDALDALFWNSEFTVRFGPGQNLYGFEAIAAFRVGRVGGSPQRTIFNSVITTFGADFATATTEFQRAGADRPGRQSQSWVRFAEGWRVVSAHISMLSDGH
ncbi:MAG: oxalurate catabolism protein HpxZ [Sphingomonadaceae bacterium]